MTSSNRHALLSPCPCKAWNACVQHSRMQHTEAHQVATCVKQYATTQHPDIEALGQCTNNRSSSSPWAYQIEVVALLYNGLVGQHMLHSSIQLSNVLGGELQGPLAKPVLVVPAIPCSWRVHQGVGLNRTLPAGHRVSNKMGACGDWGGGSWLRSCQVMLPPMCPQRPATGLWSFNTMRLWLCGSSWHVIC
jgi:hypothetical protein